MKLTIERRSGSELLIVQGADNTDILPGTKYFRNFSGAEKKQNGKVVNSEGRRNFCLALNFPEEVLDELAEFMGDSIVEFASTNTEEYGDKPLRFVRIQISEGGKNPASVYLVNDAKKKKKQLIGKQMNLLDGSRFSNADLVFRTWHKEDGKVSLYLNTASFSIEMNPIEAKLAEYDEVLGDDDYELPFNED